MAYNRYSKNKSLEPRKFTGRPRKIIERYQKSPLRWLEKDPFVSPERLQVLFNSFSPDTRRLRGRLLDDYWEDVGTQEGLPEKIYCWG